MAVDACSESSPSNTSPHNSFSLNLHNTNPSSPSPLDSSFEFNFLNENSIKIKPFCSADELFSHGLIRTKQIEPKFTSLGEHNSSSSLKIPMSSISPLSIRNYMKLENSKVEESPKKVVITIEPKSESKSFWRIKRSNSIHYDNSYKKSSFWSLPLLSRSNSTGLVPYTKLRSKKDNKEQSSTKKTNASTNVSSSSSQRPPFYKKNGVKYNGNGVRISPMLNVHPPTNLFGWGSLFSYEKDKKGSK